MSLSLTCGGDDHMGGCSGPSVHAGAVCLAAAHLMAGQLSVVYVMPGTQVPHTGTVRMDIKAPGLVSTRGRWPWRWPQAARHPCWTSCCASSSPPAFRQLPLETGTSRCTMQRAIVPHQLCELTSGLLSICCTAAMFCGMPGMPPLGPTCTPGADTSARTVLWSGHGAECLAGLGSEHAQHALPKAVACICKHCAPLPWNIKAIDAAPLHSWMRQHLRAGQGGGACGAGQSRAGCSGRDAWRGGAASTHGAQHALHVLWVHCGNRVCHAAQHVRGQVHAERHAGPAHPGLRTRMHAVRVLLMSGCRVLCAPVQPLSHP